MLEVVSEELAEGLVAGERFRLERRIGAGGMGEVWEATHLVTRKSVALKFLSPARASDARSHARLLREARAAAKVRHENVATIHDVGQLESGLPFLVMDLMEGETLSARLARDGRLAPSVLAPLAIQVVDAVAAAHAAGVVHRDLKPDNVFLGADGVVKVFDFGIAKLARGEEPTSAQPLTTTGEVVGTSLYMAPEQLFAESDVDARADVWSLGVTLYEALAGVVPTRGESVGQVLKAITTDDVITPLRRVAPEVPADLARCVTRMLARDRRARPTLAEVREVLVAVGAGRSAPGNARWIAVGLACGVAGLATALFATRSNDVAPARALATYTAPSARVVYADAPLRAPSKASATVEPGAVDGPPRPSASPSAAPPREIDAGARPEPSAAGIILSHDRR